jgi:hypothetical protein
VREDGEVDGVEDEEEWGIIWDKISSLNIN